MSPPTTHPHPESDPETVKTSSSAVEEMLLTEGKKQKNEEVHNTDDHLVPSVSTSAVLVKSVSMPEDTPICLGFDFNKVLNLEKEMGDNDSHLLKSLGIPKQEKNAQEKSSVERSLLDSLMSSYYTMGFQSTKLALAIRQIDAMRSWRLSDTPYRVGVDDSNLASPSVRSKIRSRIFLGYTSNQITSGQREIIKFLVQHKMVDVIVTTAGGIEEDIIKCLHPTYMGDFRLPGRELRSKGLNRVGNLLIPNKNYCDFEDWLTPLLHTMHDEQDLQSGRIWTPSKFIERLGKEIDHDDSVLTWAYRNSIPIFCPALTDGSIGDMLYFHSYKRDGFILDINADIRRINDLSIRSHATGMIILGGGVVKHHICNANLMRNGADWSVYVNTAAEFDGSDAGAEPDEAVSWGKIKATAEPVKLCADASLVFPLIVSQTFAKDVVKWKKTVEECVCWIDD